MTKKENTSYFHKKVYKLDHSPIGDHIGSETLKKNADSSKSDKKIIPSLRLSGLREEYKKTFLPLLIETFELRQMLENYQAKQDPLLPDFLFQKGEKSPQEILNKLEQLQKGVEESQRWCNGLVLQIAKGIEEAKDILELIETPSQKPQEKPSLLKKLLFWKKEKSL
ncbi:MAG: hypothetical protein WDZ28_01540 [Simkaniaceae bacterium]